MAAAPHAHDPVMEVAEGESGDDAFVEQQARRGDDSEESHCEEDDVAVLREPAW